MGNMNVVRLETHCLYGELDRAIPALFELPGVPTADSQIHRATEAIKKGCDPEQGPILTFRAVYSPLEGYMSIYQVLKDRPHPLPLWGMRNIPVTP